MANYYTIVVPEDGLRCTKQAADRIATMLDEADESDSGEHGFTVNYEAGEMYLVAEEVGDWDMLPRNALEAIGKLISKAQRLYWEFGVSYTASRLVAGSYGGTAFRIMPDGTISTRRCMWEDDPDTMEVC